ncbi:phosphoribosyltransferase/competence protein F [Acetobacter cibinongensis]|nr:phosphoribosyltransferase/competence protein F [Acetobacter cibinongensis]
MWSQARAAFVYDKAIRELILQLKYADRQENASFLGEHMARAGHGLIHLESIITPVPAHKRRLRQRRYNQAALLAQVIARKSAAHYVPDMLERTRATTRLSGFSRRERYEEMKEAIQVRPHMLRRVAGRHIVLVDDLLTTGATASVSAQALLENGAASVCLLVAALVPMQKEIDLDSPIAETA